MLHYLRLVRHKDGARQIPGNARPNVQDGRAQRPDQALQIGQQQMLEGDTDDQMDESGVQQKRREEPIELVRVVDGHEMEHAAHIVQARDLRARASE